MAIAQNKRFLVVVLFLLCFISIQARGIKLYIDYVLNYIGFKKTFMIIFLFFFIKIIIIFFLSIFMLFF